VKIWPRRLECGHYDCAWSRVETRSAKSAAHLSSLIRLDDSPSWTVDRRSTRGMVRAVGDAILIVEDVAVVARALVRIVQPFGMPFVAGDLAQARRLLATPARWRAVVIDLGLPDGSGLELVPEVKEKAPGVPILVVTGSQDRAHANEACVLGASVFFKPVEPWHLRQYFHRVLSEAKGAGQRSCPPLGDPARPPVDVSECIERVAALLTKRQDIRTRYAVGSIVAAVKANVDRYGRSAVATIAAAVGEDVPSLYRYAAVTERWSEPAVEALLARRGRGGRPLSWSHLVLLGTIESVVVRDSLIQEALDESLSVRRLQSRIQVAGTPVST
jgi:DNA-binding response OmpR family regulator